jgi:hypothetical protein
VKRVLNFKGKFICLTLAESHVLGIHFACHCSLILFVVYVDVSQFSGYILTLPFSALLFSKFRFGWKMSVQAIPQKPSSKPDLCTFMVVAEKENSSALHFITALFDHSSLDCIGNQVS